MAMTKKPVTGMKDMLPAEMQVRDYVIGLIKETYKGFGFTPMETPCVEHIENLCSKQGGDNEKLIFKILKRGEKLNLETAQSEQDLVDSGLRYDLTVPLARYYANNSSQLPTPFKALQVGSVWRAERPQKGRFRQFVQCDIDILGDPTNLAEIELILATTTLLGKLGFQQFKVRINDRAVLKAMADSCGFPEDAYDKVFIILDKMDKIGMEGVEKELLESGFAADCVDKYLGLFKAIEGETEPIDALNRQMEGGLDSQVAEGLKTIMESAKAAAATEFDIVFDPTLVRGMSYYTGTIFEIEMPEFGSSVAGGGRYDKMIGRFTGNETCACGFSIGFERIILLLMESGFQVPKPPKKIAYLIEKGVGGQALCDIIARAQEARQDGSQVLVARMNKNKKFQKEQLTAEGYEEFAEFYREALKN